ncbi:MAG: hypothetical protein ACYCY8_11220 [Burkholderiales bacterium]
MIGIDSDRRLFYEGSGNYGHGIWPSPVISVAHILPPDGDLSGMPKSPDIGTAQMVFREDIFDPVTRVRRGRFYINPGQQPQEWHVHIHPAFTFESGVDTQGNIIKRLNTFRRWFAPPELQRETGKRIVALGASGSFTLWKLVGIERIVTGEDLFTLRARSPLGVLPEIQPDLVPDNGRIQVLETMEKVIETAYRSGPESVIDRCRDAAQASLGVWMNGRLNDSTVRRIDLGDQIKKLEGLEEFKDRPVVLIGVGKTLSRLHARCKPNEQMRREGRIPVEDDAESAISMLGLLYRELGWCIA